MSLQLALQWIGGLGVVAAVVTGFAYALFRHFAQGWLDDRFARKLEELRHAQAKDLEAMRYQVSGLLDRAAHLNDAEFKVLPEAWQLLNEAYFQALGHVASLKSPPDVDRMSPEQLEEFLAETKLSETQKNEVRRASEKTFTYMKVNYWHEKWLAEERARKFSRFIEFNGIFLKEKSEFRVMADIIWDALVEHSMNEEMDMKPRQREKVLRLEGEGKLAHDALEDRLHERVWSLELPPPQKT